MKAQREIAVAIRTGIGLVLHCQARRYLLALRADAVLGMRA
jgi:hypothetical protein